MNGQLYILGN